MKKLLLFLILLIPFYVYAEDSCNQNDIQIESITLDSTQGNIEQTTEPNTDNNQINLGLKANVIDDNATYKVVIKNTSDQDYTFDKSSLSTDYLDYDITYDDDSDIVKAGESKTIYLTVHYATKPSTENLNNGVLTENPTVAFSLSKEIDSSILNPNTMDKIGIYVLILIISLILTIILLRKYKKTKYITMLIISFVITTQIVKAVCTCNLDINTNLEIDAKEAIFLKGEEVNQKMKQLAGTDTSSVPEEQKYTAIDTNITAVKYSETEPSDENKTEEHTVSVPESGYPIYMWFDNGTIYWWSEDDTPSLNEKAIAMFGYMHNLADVSGVSTFDLSNTQSINSIFYNSKLTNLDDIKNWNTKEIKDFSWVFTNNHYLINVEGIKNWNVKSAVYLKGLFMACFSLEEVDLSAWETSEALRNIYGMFAMCTDEGKPTMEGILKRVYLSDKFNTSKVTNMGHFLSNDDEIEDYEFLKYLDTSSAKSFQAIFQNNYNFNSIEYIKDWDTSNLMMLDWAFFNNKSLDDITGLSNWNTSNLKYMSDVFERDILISDFSEIENWDTSNVENMNSLFEDCSNVTKLNLSKWNTSKVKDMGYMFNGLTSLEELDISSFDTSNVTTFKRMFNNSTALKHIYIGDGWDTSANADEETVVFPASSSLPNYDPTDSTRQYLSHAHTGEGGYLELKPTE